MKIKLVYYFKVILNFDNNYLPLYTLFDFDILTFFSTLELLKSSTKVKKIINIIAIIPYINLKLKILTIVRNVKAIRFTMKCYKIIK
jgi:hypothetical protein